MAAVPVLNPLSHVEQRKLGGILTRCRRADQGRRQQEQRPELGPGQSPWSKQQEHAGKHRPRPTRTLGHGHRRPISPGGRLQQLESPFQQPRCQDQRQLQPESRHHTRQARRQHDRQQHQAEQGNGNQIHQRRDHGARPKLRRDRPVPSRCPKAVSNMATAAKDSQKP